jgi:hypothetical protein
VCEPQDGAELSTIPSYCMPARPFTPGEIQILESYLLSNGRFRDRMLLIAGGNVGYRITELLTWTVGQVRCREGEGSDSGRNMLKKFLLLRSKLRIFRLRAVSSPKEG